MQEGWIKHIPLSAFVILPSEALIDRRTGKARVHNVAMDEAEEPCLSQAEFLQAVPHFVECIRRHYPATVLSKLAYWEDMAVQWDKHFAQVICHARFTNTTGLLLDYSLRVRRQFPLQRFAPCYWQDRMWSSVLENYVLAQAVGKVSVDGYAVTAQPVAPNTARETQKGYGQERRSQFTSFRASIDARDIRCTHCGKGTHKGINCVETVLPFLKRNTPQGPVRCPDGSPICFSFNGAIRCRRSSCAFSHICSLCSSKDHRSQHCSPLR